MSEQKYPFKRLLLVISVMLSRETSILFCNSPRIFTRSSSYDERKSRSIMFSEIKDLFLDAELLVTLAGQNVCILEEFRFSSWNKIFFVFVKSIVFSPLFSCNSLFKHETFWSVVFSTLSVTTCDYVFCFFFLVVQLSVIKVSSIVISSMVLSVLVFSFIPLSFRVLLLSTLIASLTVLVQRKLSKLSFEFSLLSQQSLSLLCDGFNSTLSLSTFWALRLAFCWSCSLIFSNFLTSLIF